MSAPAGPAAAPWRSLFLEHIRTMPSPTFSLSTLSVQQHLPRVRTVVFRGMWASLPANPKNDAELNPGAFTSDMPTVTTDVRMDKVPELLDSSSNDTSYPATTTTIATTGTGKDAPQSAVGGAYEACFWFEEPRTQWRIRGHVCIVGQDIESDAAAPVRAALRANMRAVAAEDEDKDEDKKSSAPSSGARGVADWSWSRELTAHFGNLSPLMRGSFKNPQPGSHLSDEPGLGLGLGLGQRVTDNHDAIARRNFRVLVLVPEEVDLVDLSDPERARRWSYSLQDDGSWRTEELWP